jgi:hypothetical protein
MAVAARLGDPPVETVTLEYGIVTYERFDQGLRNTASHNLLTGAVT